MMLDEVLHQSGHSGTPLVSVDQSISCLKEVLDMMLELHVHTEVKKKIASHCYKVLFVSLSLTDDCSFLFKHVLFPKCSSL